MHTRLIDEVDEWKIQRSLRMVREMGAPTIVEFFPWAYIEGREVITTGARQTESSNQARNQGIHIIARTGLVPEWARARAATANLRRSTPCRKKPILISPRSSPLRRALCRRHRPDHHLERAEPRLRMGLPAGRPGRLYAAASGRLRAGPRRQPERRNPGGRPRADARTGRQSEWPERPDLPRSALRNRRGRLRRAGRPCLRLHPAARRTGRADKLNFRRAELLHAIMARTATATNRSTSPKPAGTTTRAGQWRLSHRSGRPTPSTPAGRRLAVAGRMCLWAFRYPPPTHSYPDNYTLVTPTSSPNRSTTPFRPTRAAAAGAGLWLPARRISPPPAPIRRYVVLLALRLAVILRVTCRRAGWPPGPVCRMASCASASTRVTRRLPSPTRTGLYGLEIDLARALAAQLGVPVRFVTLGYDGLTTRSRPIGRRADRGLQIDLARLQ